MRSNGRLRLKVTPGRPLQGSYKPHGDKSLAHRAALLAAVGQGESTIDNFLVAGVTQAMLRALSALGVALELGDDRLIVRGLGIDGLTPPREALDCGNSATTLRLLAGGLAAAGVRATLDGSPGLRRRPMGRIVEPLRLMGVPVTAEDNRAPLTLGAGHMPLQALTYRLPVASAQVKSCLLLAGLAASGVTTLDEPGPSRDHTERMLRNLGFQVCSEVILTENVKLYRTRLEPPRRLAIPAQNLSLPGDMSAAAFLIVAALITPGSEVMIRDVGLNPTRTGLVETLQAMGADIQVRAAGERHGEPVGDLSVRYSSLRGTQVSGETVVRMIDEFPVFAVAAAFAQGDTVVCQADELRHKEADRIGALCQQLLALGGEVVETPDGFVVQGKGGLKGGEVEAHGDHRLAMALAVAGLAAAEAVVVDGAEAYYESFPDFAQALQSLGAQTNVEAAGG
jgi:3-phosphoshikimate 1-carboxyvinyltransferase